MEPNDRIAKLKLHYLYVWASMLKGWLKWPEERFNNWVQRWLPGLEDRDNGLFYHEDELYYVIHLLIPDSLKDRLQGHRTQHRYYDDLAELISGKLYPAILGSSPYVALGQTTDWEAARQRVIDVLAQYGSAMPSAHEITRYEKGILGTAND
jgi:hypothetical protein